MSYRVVFYCPDRHVTYDGSTPEKRGVGGGITARVRMARALRRLGHEVAVVANCRRRSRIDGVLYLPLEEVRHISADVLILNTSGGALDLSQILQMKSLDVAFTIVWVQGFVKPQGLEDVGFDCLYAVSNFIAGVAEQEWDVPRRKMFVSYNGYERDVFKRAERRRVSRDPYRLVYFSHPSKGMEAAKGVLRILRQRDARFHLDVYGGFALWGQEEAKFEGGEGLRFRGMIGQGVLARELLKCSYSLNLQSRQEPGALVIAEAMRAGCIILGSPVGCYPEYVAHGYNGLLIAGDPDSRDVWERTANTVLALMQNPAARDYFRGNAQRVTWDTDTIARSWTSHWAWWFSGGKEWRCADPSRASCERCGGCRLLLEDGYHCVACGLYTLA